MQKIRSIADAQKVWRNGFYIYSESLAERREHNVVEKANELYLSAVLTELGSDALVEAAGLIASGRDRSSVRVQSLSRPGIHPVGVVHVSNGTESAALFAKVQRTDYRGAQNLEREVGFLSDIGPLIAAVNPALRCPSPIAYYPERGLLLMEFVPGDSLKNHLFELKLELGTSKKTNLANLLECTGRWLGSLHRVSQQEDSGNPLEWLLQEFESKRTREVFERFSYRSEYQEFLSILRTCISSNPGFRRNLCRVHGEFTPIHVMIAEDAIYAVDFGNNKTGYAHEDVSLFLSFYDCLLPWRAAAGAMRIGLAKQKKLFLHAYLDQASFGFGPADWAIMSWMRLISFGRIFEGGDKRHKGLSKLFYSTVALRSLRASFTSICRAELASLRALSPAVFGEDSSNHPSPGRSVSERSERSAGVFPQSLDRQTPNCEGTVNLSASRP